MRNRSLLRAQILVLASIIALPFGGGALPAQQQPDPYGVYHVGNGVTLPKPTFMPQPEYTESARKKKINGTVVVTMIVTPEGKVRAVKVTKSLDKDLDKQAIATVGTWKFEPAT